MQDIILIAVILVILITAGVYVYRAKKSGAHCIGCPSSKECGGRCSCGTHKDGGKAESEACEKDGCCSGCCSCKDDK